jgi:hypothetical protein
MKSYSKQLFAVAFRCKLRVAIRSLRERVGAELEFHDLGLDPFAAFDVIGRPASIG